MNVPPPNQDPNPVDLQRQVPGRGLARLLFVLACIATVVALFYLVENWRGNRVWKKYRHEFEAQGNSLNWADFIPPQVPDDQNAFKAPRMQEWFVKGPSNYSPKFPDKSFSRPTTETLDEFLSRRYTNRTNIVVAEVTLASATDPDPENAAVVRDLNDPVERKRAQSLMNDVTGPIAIGAQGLLLFSAQPFEQLKPAAILLKMDRRPSIQEVSAFFEPADKSPNPGATRFRVVSAGTNTFRIYLDSPPCLAADYLEWSDPLEADFDLMREALKRPFARMEGDYEPAALPIPGFVRLRQVAQTLAQRTQCYLLLGKSEAAFHDLALVRELCVLLEARPTGKPIMLVGAMINVAITGLYTAIVADGLRLHAWREQELHAIEEQLKQVYLPPLVAEAFRGEAAYTCRRIETGARGELANLLAFGPNPASLWQKLKSPRFILFMLMPKGWIYQNMAAVTFADQKWINALSYTNTVVDPRQVDSLGTELQNNFTHFSPYKFIAATSIPNFQKAIQVLAHNQSLADQALLACALEQYHLANKRYPETLEALTPRFLQKLPHDIITGQSLKYRLAGEEFVLYSIGWNQIDEGGKPGKAHSDGDWVWAGGLK